MKILFTRSAREELFSAVTYIHKENPIAARRFRKRTETVLRRLINFPESGRPIPEFPDLPFREVIIAPYRFFYRVIGKQIWIVGV